MAMMKISASSPHGMDAPESQGAAQQDQIKSSYFKLTVQFLAHVVTQPHD